MNQLNSLSTSSRAPFKILWDRKGTLISSESLAKLFQEKIDLSENINMVIGGSYGVSKELTAHADLSLSASHLTFLSQTI